MLNRDQQRLLAETSHFTAVEALLDRIRGRGTFEGGRTTSRPGHWISYNKKAVWLDDHSEFAAALRAASGASALPTGETAAWRQIRPKCIVRVTWAQAAAYGATLPSQLRTDLAALQQAERDENQLWWEFSEERGGWPWRSKFASDAEHASAATAWDEQWRKHLATLDDLRDRRRTAIGRALPLALDDEPSDLLELLEHQTAAPRATAATAAALQASALRQTNHRGHHLEDDRRFTPGTATGPGR